MWLEQGEERMGEGGGREEGKEGENFIYAYVSNPLQSRTHKGGGTRAA